MKIPLDLEKIVDICDPVYSFNKVMEHIDLRKYYAEKESVTVTFSKKRNFENIEITISASGTFFRCETSDETFRNALDKAVDTIDRQIRKNKTRLEKRFRKTEFVPPVAEEELSEQTEKVVRQKNFKLVPMSTEEAILQMNLLGHSFFMFENADNGLVCVVYARNDGDYGLIVPEKD